MVFGQKLYSVAVLNYSRKSLCYRCSLNGTQLQSLLEGAQSTSPASACDDDVICYRGERSSPSAEKEFNYDATPSLSLSFDLHLSAIRTPDIVSTPLSVESNCSYHCHPREEDVGSKERQCSSSGGVGIVECVGVSPLQDSSSTSDSLNIEQSSSPPRDGYINGCTTTKHVSSLNSEQAATLQPSSTAADTSNVDLKRPLSSFNLDDVNDGLSVTCDSGKDCVDVNHRDMGEGASRKDEVWSKECIRVHVKHEVEENGSHDSHVISSDSSEDDADDKLEKCKFSKIRDLWTTNVFI